MYRGVLLGYYVLPEHGRVFFFDFCFLLGTVCEAVRGTSPFLVHSVLVRRGAAASGKGGRCGWRYLLRAFACLEAYALDRLVGPGGQEFGEFERWSRADEAYLHMSRE